jgi:hypothetical protein
MEALHAGREVLHPEAASAGKEPISKLCDKLGLQPTVFYRWQKEFFENGASAFEQKAQPNHRASLVPKRPLSRGTIEGYRQSLRLCNSRLAGAWRNGVRHLCSASLVHAGDDCSQ